MLQKPNRATAADLAVFHTKEYIAFLEQAKADTVTEQQVDHFNVMQDSPVFDGVFQFCQIYAGASIHGAQKLIQDDYDIAINWAGGLHHAKKGQAEGVIFNFSSCQQCQLRQCTATRDHLMHMLREKRTGPNSVVAAAEDVSVC